MGCWLPHSPFGRATFKGFIDDCLESLFGDAYEFSKSGDRHDLDAEEEEVARAIANKG